MNKISIRDLMIQALQRGLSEEDAVFEAKRRFSKNTIGRLGGLKRLAELYRELRDDEILRRVDP